MNPAAESVANIDTHGDPFLELLKWFVVVVIIVFAAATPVMHYWRKFNSDKALNAKDSADQTLYLQLSEQLKEQKDQLDSIYEAHNKLVIDHGSALSRLSKVEEYESTIDSMKSRLEEKDRRLDSKDEEIRREREHNRHLTLEVINLKDRIGQLEKRLLVDEQKFCFDCVKLGKNSLSSKIQTSEENAPA